METKYDLCIIGGAGHVGLPLGVVFANAGVRTVLLDINKDALQKIQSGKFPFTERGGDEALRSALDKKALFTTSSPEVISDSKYIVVVVGTPIDEYLNPYFGSITKLLDDHVNYFRDGQVLILRSTVYPGTTEKIQNYFIEKGKQVRLAFCPERITQSYAIEELKVLPQIVSAFDKKTLEDVTTLFGRITKTKTVSVKPIEAELAKLFTNSWRYIRFAVANQFFMIAQDHGLNYHDIESAMKKDYARNSDLPSPGFAAGPCLFKDTMQLAAFTNNNFWLGHSAMLVNEGLVNHVIRSLKRENGDSLKKKTLGILGMAFKPEVDDPRDSLSYKLRKVAQLECKKVLCTDVHIKDPSFVSVDNLLRDSDIVVLATAHNDYKNIDPKKYPGKKFIDIRNFWGLSGDVSDNSLFSA